MLHLTAKNFQIEVKDTSLPVVVMFYAIWCGKCAMMKPVVEDIEKKYAGKIKFCEVEIEESAVLAAEYAPEIDVYKRQILPHPHKKSTVHCFSDD